MRIALALIAVLMLTAGAVAAIPVATRSATSQATRADIERAREQARDAAARGERLEREAAQNRIAAEKSAQQAAALAARVQQAEAERLIAAAQLASVRSQRRRLEADLSQERRPLLGLTAALQRLTRAPPALAMLRPGSVEDTVRARALMDSMLPEIERRTAGLRGQLAAIRTSEAREVAAARDLRTTERTLALRRKELLGLETEQRLASRRLGGAASREEERALALAEEARDLSGLLATLDADNSLRERLARLPGPKIRPARPDEARVSATASARPAGESPPTPYFLPANGRLAQGFGNGSRGVLLSVRPGAMVTAPGAGRVGFAGPYSGYGRIVILQHANGWTSLVTGLGRLDVAVGEDVVAGGPLGIADPRLGEVVLELRRGGEPVNPLRHIR